MWNGRRGQHVKNQPSQLNVQRARHARNAKNVRLGLTANRRVRLARQARRGLPSMLATVKNADPKWLIPLLCRRGDVDKSAIGKIRVLARETHVEILAGARKKFAEAIARPIAPNDKDKSIRIAALKAEQD